MYATMFLALSLPVAQASAPASAAQTAARTAIAQAAEPGDCVKALQTFLWKRRQEVQPATGFTSELLKQVDEEKFASQDGKTGRPLAPEEELKRDLGYFQGHHLDVPVPWATRRWAPWIGTMRTTRLAPSRRSI